MRARDSGDLEGQPGVGEPEENATSFMERAALDDRGPVTPDICGSEKPDPGIDTALSRTIESEIIPRLLMAYRTDQSTARRIEPDTTFTSADVEAFTTLAVEGTLPELQRFVEEMRARGVTTDAVVADFLPAAARLVGWQWETDVRTFVDVTFACTRLQQVLRHYAPSLEVDSGSCGEGRRILLSTMPGEQHTFGLSVVEEFFRHAAWDVAPATPATSRHLLAVVRDEWFDVVGLSAGADATIEAVRAMIQKIRTVSMNRSLRVIVGGNALTRHPDGGASLGADAVARDPREALAQVEWMMLSLQQPC